MIARTVPDGISPIRANTSVYWVVPSSSQIRKIAMARPTSPTRFIRNAFLAAVAADGRSW